MGEAQRELELGDVIVERSCKEEKSSSSSSDYMISRSAARSADIRRWVRVAIYSFFLLSGQSIATLLGRLYYTKGGSGVWVESVAQVIGFPVLLPLYYYVTSKTSLVNINTVAAAASYTKLAFIYVSLGVLIAANTILFTMGLRYLPVSTSSLICASQLGFNAFFSSFLNAQKFTPYIINSIFVLTISSVILVFHSDSTTTDHVPRGKYMVGFISTLGGSAGFGLYLALSQMVFKKVLLKGSSSSSSFKVVLDMVVYTLIVASVVMSVGLLASGEWKGVRKEMEEYELGRVSYMMNLIGTAVLWQVFQLGCIGLVFEVSSLFSNVVGTLGVPMTPVLAVIFLHDKMNGLKVVSMLLAIWGFISYAYQQYLDEKHFKSKDNKLQSVQLASDT
ncbi:hypothetical protein Dimus_031012 [Dionaea muscipula]